MDSNAIPFIVGGLYISVIIVALIIGATRQNDKLRKKKDVKRINKELKEFYQNKEYSRVFSNFTYYDKNNEKQIVDFLILSHNGLFVIDVCSVLTPIDGKINDKFLNTRPVKNVPSRNIPNPFIEVKKHEEDLAYILEISEDQIIPLVVFSRNQKFKEGKDIQVQYSNLISRLTKLEKSSKDIIEEIDYSELYYKLDELYKINKKNKK